MTTATTQNKSFPLSKPGSLGIQHFESITEPEVVGGLKASAVLIDLSISEWVGRKKDQKNTESVVTSNRATSKDAAHVTKKLFVENPKLQEILRRTAKARQYVAQVTLPWMGDLRMLPMTSFLTFQEKMSELQNDFQDAVDDFLNDYDTQVAAMAFKLGDLFDRNEYPTVEYLRARFKFDWKVMPLPDSDFRVKAEDTLREELRQAYEKVAHDMVANAMKNVWERLHACLHHMADRLGYSEDGKPNVFRDSMLENAKELVNLLKDLNVTGDERMEQVRRELQSAIEHVDPKELRNNQHVREDVRNSVQDILNKFAI